MNSAWPSRRSHHGRAKKMGDIARRKKAFSLVELVIVLVIIGIIAAIAIPRLTRGATNASATAVAADLAVLRNAIELYRAEHEGEFPTVADFASQLTQFSNIAGNAFSVTPNTGTGIIYGPYLKSIPGLPVGAKKSSTGIAAADGVGVGWIYTVPTGEIKTNTTALEADLNGKVYNTY
jgi:general secretion pathway protein G